MYLIGWWKSPWTTFKKTLVDTKNQNTDTTANIYEYEFEAKTSQHILRRDQDFPQNFIPLFL